MSSDRSAGAALTANESATAAMRRTPPARSGRFISDSGRNFGGIIPRVPTGGRAGRGEQRAVTGTDAGYRLAIDTQSWPASTPRDIVTVNADGADDPQLQEARRCENRARTERCLHRTEQLRQEHRPPGADPVERRIEALE